MSVSSSACQRSAADGTSSCTTPTDTDTGTASKSTGPMRKLQYAHAPSSQDKEVKVDGGDKSSSPELLSFPRMPLQLSSLEQEVTNLYRPSLLPKNSTWRREFPSMNSNIPKGRFESSLMIFKDRMEEDEHQDQFIEMPLNFQCTAPTPPQEEDKSKATFSEGNSYGSRCGVLKPVARKAAHAPPSYYSTSC